MLRAIACAVLLSALPCAAHSQDVQLNVIEETLELKKGDNLDAEQTFAEGQPVVRVRLAPAAAVRFGEITSRNVRKVMQVVIGDRILTAPVIMDAITGGELIIQGRFTIQEAADLAKRIK